MKSQVAWNWKAGRTELVVTSGKGEHLVLQEAEWLHNKPTSLLLPVDFEYAHVQARKAVLRYDIMGKSKLLKQIKKYGITSKGMMVVLEGLEQTLVACANAGRIADKMLFDPEHVYVDESLAPHFVYVPLSSMRYDAAINSPFVLLDAISNPKYSMLDSSEAVRRRDALQKFVVSEKVFSLNSFRRLLDREFRGVREVDSPSPMQDFSQARDTRDAPLFMEDLFTGGTTEQPSETLGCIRHMESNQMVVFPLDQEVSVGRSQTCDVVIRGNDLMGRRHLTIMANKDGALLVDCGSTNGTYAFNQRLKPGIPVRLSMGDKFLVGGEEYVISTCRS